MEGPHITTDDVTQHIRNIKEKKSAGPDGIKPDLLKILRNDIQFINSLAEAMSIIITKRTTYKNPGMHQNSIGTQNKETNRKRSTTNIIDKCNSQIIYWNSKVKN